MIIRVKKRENPFVQIDKRCLEDSRLSWKAKGVLAYLLSKPDAWEVKMSDLLKRGADGRDAVQAALAELKEHGYADLVRVMGEHGRFAGTAWTIREVPTRRREPGFPSLGKSATSNNERRDNDTHLPARNALKRGEFTAPELAVIDQYHQTCVASGLGFLPITCRSPELAKELEIHRTASRDDFTDLFSAAVEARRNGGKRRTLVGCLKDWSTL